MTRGEFEAGKPFPNYFFLSQTIPMLCLRMGRGRAVDPSELNLECAYA